MALSGSAICTFVYVLLIRNKPEGVTKIQGLLGNLILLCTWEENEIV